MSMTINTNVASLNAQRNLSGSQSALNTSLQRLSSGLRINSAKDDAAGLAISERMSSQIRGLDQARRNANDGISLAQTAEGAMGEIGSNLQRVRELAVQSANATNSASDREAINKEVQQLLGEITRVADTTSFNGIKILNGDFKGQSFQVGANANQTIGVSINDSRASSLGLTQNKTQTSVITAGAGAITTTGVLTVNGITIDTAGAKDLNGVVSAVNAKQATTGVSATRAGETTVALGAYTPPAAAGSISINDYQIDLAIGDTLDTAVEKINKFSAQTGAVASKNAGAIELKNSDGSDIKIKGSAAGVAGASVTAADVTYSAGIEFNTALGGAVTVAGAMATSLNLAANASNLSLTSQSVLTATNAQGMIKAVDQALQQINSNRADLGAVQNRFSSVISTLQSSSENLSASRGRIQDADFASETAKMSRNQVLQQAGTAMLAQANQLPQQVLQLLR